MDENGIGLNEIASDGGTWWYHVCECGHSWNAMQQVDTCWLCGEMSISTMDQQSADSKERRIEVEDIPEELLNEIIE